MANRSLSDRLFSGVYPTGIVYADRARSRGGDYERVAFLSFSTLELEVARGQEKSPLLPLVREDAARLQARRGQRYEVSASGQYVVLGHGRLAGRSEPARYLIDHTYEAVSGGSNLRDAKKFARDSVASYAHGIAGVLDRKTGKYVYIAKMVDDERGEKIIVMTDSAADKWWREWISSARGRSAGRTSGITGKQLFDEALPKIQSPSVRKWAESNRATFEQIGARSLEKRPYDRDSATRFATYITIRAMEG